MRTLLFCLAVIAGFSFANPSFAAPQASQPPAAAQNDEAAMLAGPWRGLWAAPGPTVYQGELTLQQDAPHHVTGTIRWILVQSPQDQLQDKIGQSGTEYLNGDYDADHRVLSLRTDHMDDPHQILGPDAYRMLLTGDGQYLVGATENGGNWAARIDLRRQLPGAE